MGKIYVTGIGPGAYEQMTIEAQRILKKSDVIIGYTVYVELIRNDYPDKEFITTPMHREVERCELAFAQAAAGRTVAFICSGDAGVYGMSGLMLELGQRYPDIEVKIISGVTAATAGAAVLGAPLMHDFAVISLSDLLTPWELICKRLSLAAEGDFVICLYNPSSKNRADYLKKACQLVLEYRSADTVCGIVERIGREGQNARVLSLEQLRNTKVNMFTTVYIGNSQTKELQGRMVTPRGYVL